MRFSMETDMHSSCTFLFGMLDCTRIDGVIFSFMTNCLYPLLTTYNRSSNHAWLITTADCLFSSWQLKKQIARFICRSARGIKNRYLVACQDDGHWSRDLTTVPDNGTISEFSIIHFLGSAVEASLAWTTYWELHLAAKWESQHDLHSVAGLLTCHQQRLTIEWK